MLSDSGFSYYFEDRKGAARKLIEALPLGLLQKNEAVIISVSEGGVYFADQIAKAVHAPMDILLTEPILASNNPEIAIAMASETEEVVMHRALVLKPLGSAKTMCTAKHGENMKKKYWAMCISIAKAEDCLL
ncbi:MAG: putative phosphoribosyl transferase [Campylobacterota bacterium]|nr:putative phosphoribosyl transferase [Campylobacterota bacterium]